MSLPKMDRIGLATQAVSSPSLLGSRIKSSWLGWWQLGLCLLLIGYRIGRLDDKVYDMHAWRQSETVMMIEAYYRDGIDLTMPKVGWLGPYKYRAYEFPIIEAVAAVLYYVLGNHLWIMKALALAGFLAGVGYIYLLARRLSGHSLAVWSAFLFLAQPLSIYYSVSLQIDYIAIAATLGMAVHASAFLQEGKRWHSWAFGVLFLLAGLLKPPYILPAAVFIAAQAFWLKPHWVRLGTLSVVSLPALTATLWWIWHSDGLDANVPPLTFLPGFSNHPDKALWYFGTGEQLSNAGNYLYVLDRCLTDMTFPICAAGLAGLVMASAREDRRPVAVGLLAWLIGSMAMFLIFFNLNYIHNYYQTPLTVLVALFGGIALDTLSRYGVKTAAFAAVIMVGLSLFRCNTSFFKFTDVNLQIGEYVQTHTSPSEYLLFVNHNLPSNSPEQPAYARRFGFCLNYQTLSPERLDSVKQHQIHKMILINNYAPLSPEIEAKAQLLQEATFGPRHKVDIYALR